jgi:hypothetical protein
MPKASIDFSNLRLADALEQMGQNLINYLWLEGANAYARYVSARAESDRRVYSLSQMVAIGCSSPLTTGFNTSIARTAWLILCSYIVDRREMVESSKGFTETELCILLGVTRVPEYQAMYSPDLLDINQQLVELVNAKNAGT